jgi:hypothetical protein
MQGFIDRTIPLALRRLIIALNGFLHFQTFA